MLVAKTINLRRYYRKIFVLFLGKEGFLKQDAKSKVINKKIIHLAILKLGIYIYILIYTYLCIYKIYEMY